MAQEKNLFQNGNITVTPTRFMVGSKTYAIRNIVSTRGIEERPGCLGAMLGRPTIYRILLTTAASEASVYESSDRKLIADLLDALDTAITNMK